MEERSVVDSTEADLSTSFAVTPTRASSVVSEVILDEIFAAATAVFDEVAGVELAPIELVVFIAGSDAVKTAMDAEAGAASLDRSAPASLPLAETSSWPRGPVLFSIPAKRDCQFDLKFCAPAADEGFRLEAKDPAHPAATVDPWPFVPTRPCDKCALAELSMPAETLMSCFRADCVPKRQGGGLKHCHEINQ